MAPTGCKNCSFEVGTTSKGPKYFETAGLQRLPGVTCQKWHADAAEANSLNGAALEATPLSALHPLTVGGTTILMVPLDVLHPVQVFVPDQHALIWRSDLEHAGDEFRKLNYALFSYILPPPLPFILRTDWDGARLRFPRVGSMHRLARLRQIARSRPARLQPVFLRARAPSTRVGGSCHKQCDPGRCVFRLRTAGSLEEPSTLELVLGHLATILVSNAAPHACVPEAPKAATTAGDEPEAPKAATPAGDEHIFDTLGDLEELVSGSKLDDDLAALADKNIFNAFDELESSSPLNPTGDIEELAALFSADSNNSAPSAPPDVSLGGLINPIMETRSWTTISRSPLTRQKPWPEMKGWSYPPAPTAVYKYAYVSGERLIVVKDVLSVSKM